jgi:glycosyltransferase involved in cell wall biosynthesis/peptidoglycan/xylan/chitin deacetylase (PgdA/CDA1 family)/SAM-dependent methyltransferase
MTTLDRAARLALGRLPKDCLVALNFHRVGDELPPWHFGTTPERLVEVVSFFARTLRPVDGAELRARGIRGRLLAITFDDGFADNLEIAAPILERVGVPAAFFVSSRCIDDGAVPWPDEAYARAWALDAPRLRRLAARFAPGRPSGTRIEGVHALVHGLKYASPELRQRVISALPPPAIDAGRVLSWEEARTLGQRGFEIGSHGMTHAPLTDLDDDALRAELVDSRRMIQTRLGVDCLSIAYPDNRTDDRVLRAARDAGYELGFHGGERSNSADAEQISYSRLTGEDARLYAIVGRALRRPRLSVDFGSQAERYAEVRETEYSFRTQMRIVENWLKPERPTRVLDAGCGAGALMPVLVSVGVDKVVGIDAEPAMLDVARRRWPGHQWLRQDVTNLRLPDDAFDAVVSLGVLEYVADKSTAMQELARVARRGAAIIVSAPQRTSPNARMLRLAELLGKGAKEGSRALTASELQRLAAGAVVEVGRLRATNYFAFPITMFAPRWSERVAEWIERIGPSRVLRPFGAQLIVSLRRPPVRSLYWLAPSLPTNTTFLDRELATLRDLGVDVRPLSPSLSAGAVVAFLGRPARSLRLLIELQRLKANADKERGRLGYFLLFLRGLTLANRLNGQPGRLHATFADGVGTIAYVACALTGRPYSFTAHSPFSLWRDSRLLARQLRAASPVIAETEILERRLRELGGEIESVVARSPAPARRAVRSRDTAPLFVAVARLIPHKGFMTAIEAARIALDRGVELRLEVIGTGPELAALENAASGSGYPQQIVLRGALPNSEVLDLLRSARAMVAPCEIQPDGDRDGLPVSIVDAAAVGVPTIGTNVSSISELVVDGVTGLIVPECHPEALADAMELLAGDLALSNRLGQAAAALAVEQHDPVRNAQVMLQAWGDVDYDATRVASATAWRNCATPNS